MAAIQRAPQPCQPILLQHLFRFKKSFCVGTLKIEFLSFY